MRWLFSILCAALLVTACALPAFAAVPDPRELDAQAAVLMDAETGQVLYEKNAYDQMYPASITKIMTALLVLENLETGAVMTASGEAVDIPAWGSSAYLEEGERLTVDEAMYAMMLRSANEAANILAEEVAGSMSAFAQRMNDRARELGAQGTHFTNANGLPDRRHLTTAYDMALITRQAVDTPGFMNYFGMDSYSMEPTNLSGERIFTNTHRMLLQNYEVYSPEVLGGKTGYTTQSGYTLATVARRGGRTLICIVLNSDRYYTDTATLLDFGFEEFVPYTYLFGGGEPSEVPIWDGGREVGRAYMYRPESASLLIHESVSPGDIASRLQVPARLERGEEIGGQALVYLSAIPQEGLSDVLLSLPLETEVAPYTPQVVEVQPEGSRERYGARRPDSPSTAAVALLACSGIACILLFYRRGARRYAYARGREAATAPKSATGGPASASEVP